MNYICMCVCAKDFLSGVAATSMAALTSSARNFGAFVCVEDSDFHEDMEEELLKRRNEKKIIISANHLHAETMGDEPKNSSDAPPPQAPVSYLSPVLRRLLTVSAVIENWQWWHRVEYQSSLRPLTGASSLRPLTGASGVGR